MKLSELLQQVRCAMQEAQRKVPPVDPDVFVSLPGDERDVLHTHFFQCVREPRKWYFELQTEPEDEE